MVDNGSSDIIHNEYRQLIEFFKPDFLYVSGGEPLLKKDIGPYIRDLSKHVKEKIFLFTSFQYPKKILKSIDLSAMPFEKVVLTHTTAGFREDIWSEMTGFPFETYIDNILSLKKYPWQKRIKFIINNGDITDEFKRFKRLIKPDENFVYNLKLINEQSGSNALSKIKNSSKYIKEFLNKIDPYDRSFFEDDVSGISIIDNLKNGEISCKFRENPEEIRFSFYTANDNGIKMKFRFCPFFPLKKHYKYKIGRDNHNTVLELFNKEKWFSWCSKCRLRHYLNQEN